MLQVFADQLLKKAVFLLAIILLDTSSAVTQSIKDKTFDYKKLGDFYKKALPYLVSWLAAEILGFMPGYLDIHVAGLGQVLAAFAPDFVYAGAVLKYFADILARYNVVTRG